MSALLERLEHVVECFAEVFPRAGGAQAHCGHAGLDSVDDAVEHGFPAFADTLKDAILTVDRLQKESETAQVDYLRNEPIDLHEVLIKIEEAEIAFKTMMEIRNKLVESYREIMRMGG